MTRNCNKCGIPVKTVVLIDKSELDQEDCKFYEAGQGYLAIEPFKGNFPETLTELNVVHEPDKSFLTYLDEKCVIKEFPLCCGKMENNGDGTYTYTNGIDDPVLIDINEKDLSFVEVTDNLDGSITFTSENDVKHDLDVCKIIRDNCGAVATNNGDGSYSITDNSGNTITISIPEPSTIDCNDPVVNNVIIPTPPNAFRPLITNVSGNSCDGFVFDTVCDHTSGIFPQQSIVYDNLPKEAVTGNEYFSENCWFWENDTCRDVVVSLTFGVGGEGISIYPGTDYRSNVSASFNGSPFNVITNDVELNSSSVNIVRSSDRVYSTFYLSVPNGDSLEVCFRYQYSLVNGQVDIITPETQVVVYGSYTTR